MSIPETDNIQIAAVAAALEIATSKYSVGESAKEELEIKLERFKRAYELVIQTIKDNPPQSPPS